MPRPRQEKPRYKLTRANNKPYWYISWSEGGRTKRISTSTADEQVARRKLAEFAVMRENASAINEGTIAAMCDHYLEHKKAKYELEGAPDKNLAVLKSALSNVCEYFVDCRPSDLTRACIKDYSAWRRIPRHRKRKIGHNEEREVLMPGAKDGTIRKELQIFRAALNYGKKEGIFPGEIVAFEMPAEPPPREYCMTVEQVRKFMATDASDHVNLFAILALHTLSRKGAILDLQWDWGVNFERELIQFNPPGRIQTKKRRVAAPMNGILRKALLEAYKNRTSDYVIEYRGKPLGDIQKSFASKASRAGMEWVTPHVLRHTGASILAQAGTDMIQIAQLMGDDIQTVEKHYLKYNPDYLKGASTELERLYG